MNDEIRDILSDVKDGDKVLAYIEALEEHHHKCHCHDDDDHECSCGHHHEHHGHGDECDCGCHDKEESEWEEIKVSYENKLTVKDWEELLKNPQIFTEDALKLIKRMRHISAPVSYMELADTFGLGAMYYGIESCKLAIKLLSFVNKENLKESEYWAIIFNAWKHKSEYDTEIYALRPELYEAIGNVDLSKVPLRENEI